MGYGQPLAQRRRAKRFAMENLCQKRIGVGYFAQRYQPRRKLTDCLITAGKLRLHADSTGSVRVVRFIRSSPIQSYCLGRIVADWIIHLCDHFH